MLSQSVRESPLFRPQRSPHSFLKQIFDILQLSEDVTQFIDDEYFQVNFSTSEYTIDPSAQFLDMNLKP